MDFEQEYINENEENYENDENYDENEYDEYDLDKNRDDDGDDDDEDEYDDDDDGSSIDNESSYKDISRIGNSRAKDIDEDLSTKIENGRFDKLEKTNMSKEEVFRSIVAKIINKHNLSKNDFEESLRVMQLINKFNLRLKYKNPVAIVFATMIFDRGEININKLKSTSLRSIKEGIDIFNLLRYGIFIKNLRVMKE